MSQLAEWTVEINAKGAQALFGEVDEVEQKIEQADGAAQKTFGAAGTFSKAMNAAKSAVSQIVEPANAVRTTIDSVGKTVAGVFQRAIAPIQEFRQKIEAARQETAKTENVFQSLQKSQLLVGFAYGFLTAKILGFVRAGLAATTQGAFLSQQMGFLNREIASIFTPAIEAVTNKITALVQWLRNLNGDQQQTIRNAVVLSVSFLGILTVLPKLIGAVQLLGTVMKASLAANPILLAVAAVAALVLSTERGREAFANLFDALAPLGELVGQVFGIVMEALAPIVDLLAMILEGFGEIIATLANGMKPLFEVIGEILKGFQPIIEVIVSLFEANAGLIESIMEGALIIAEVFAAILGILELIKPLFEFIGQAIKVLLAPLTLLSRIFGGGGPRRPERERGRDNLEAQAGGFESIEASFRRIQEGAIRADAAQAAREEQLRELRQNGVLLGAIERHTRRLGAERLTIGQVWGGG